MPDTGSQPEEVLLRGSVLVLLQFDVCEEIRLDLLQELVSARKVDKPSMKHPAPGYVRYQRPPVVVPAETSTAVAADTAKVKAAGFTSPGAGRAGGKTPAPTASPTKNVDGRIIRTDLP